MNQLQVITDIKYGEHPNQSLNIFLPKDYSTKTFVLLVHGGGWKGGCKEQYNLTGIMLAEAGIACATVGYRLLPEGVFPNSSFDVLRGFQKIEEMSVEYGFSVEKIVTWGSSAGGHISLMLQCFQCKWASENIVKSVPRVVGTVAQCPVVNFEEGWYVKEHRRAYAGASKFEEVSPLHIEPELFKSVLLVQGDVDETTPLISAEAFIKRINDAGSKSELIVIKGAGHGYGYQAYNNYAKESIERGIEYVLNGL